MTFEEQGFLSEETAEIRSITRSAYSGVFRKCKEVNNLAHKLRNSINLNYDNPLHVVSICLLQKALDSFQSTVILIETGLEADSNTITRSSIEVMFILRKLSQDSNYLLRYLGSDQVQKKKILNVAKHDKRSALRRAIDMGKLDEKLSELLEDIKQYNLEEKSIEQLAHELGLDNWYQLTYRLLSSDAHSSPSSLERYMRFDENQNVTMFDFNPKTERLEAVLITQVAILLAVLDSIEKTFNCGFEEKIDSLFRSVQNFG